MGGVHIQLSVLGGVGRGGNPTEVGSAGYDVRLSELMKGHGIERAANEWLVRAETCHAILQAKRRLHTLLLLNPPVVFSGKSRQDGWSV